MSDSVRLAHVGIAVPNLAEALRFYRDVLGLEPSGHPETADGAAIVTLPFGDTNVELLEPPTAPSRSSSPSGVRASTTSAIGSRISTRRWNDAARRATGSWTTPPDGAPAAGASRSCIPKRRR